MRTSWFSTPIHSLAVSVEGTWVVVDLRNGTCWELNQTSARIWLALEQGVEVPQIAAEIAAEFDVDTARAVGDVQALVGQLRAEGLLTDSA